ncbi:NnrU family protein [Sulfitobacter aestuarii]|uniref:NnrU family protein n=1 Tax=Sulfitobacter aestuarii TaxID=2161676 RepID=A0ABW5U5N9_9RHOB
MSWLIFAGVFALFFATHSIPVRPEVKSRISDQIGARRFGIGYSILSIVMLGMLIWAAGKAPFVSLWPQMVWQRHVVHLGMLVVCLIIAFAAARPNPFSFGGTRNEEFDPQHPGIVRLTRHPVLLALALWSGLHLLSNGELAHVLMFGVLGGFAIAGRALINRRKQHEMGQARWQALNAAVRQAPLIHAPGSWGGAVWRLLAGVGGFLALLALHPLVIGVSAL